MRSWGIDYIRMDFLSWYEDGKDRNIGVVGHGYGHESYARALNYIAESAKKYGIFTSLVMPHLYGDAAVGVKIWEHGAHCRRYRRRRLVALLVVRPWKVIHHMA